MLTEHQLAYEPMHRSDAEDVFEPIILKAQRVLRDGQNRATIGGLS
jgi:hypothetical protein